ncbi:MAG: hypothetical protein ACRC1H_00060 [Caldilineaceae bacterium]
MTEQPVPYHPESDPNGAHIAQRVLERLGVESEMLPNTMASLLKQFARTEGLFSDEQLGNRLHLDATALRKLRLCLRPNGNSPLFGSQVRQIAEWVQMDPTLLANVVRQVEALEAMHESGATTANSLQVRLQAEALQSPASDRSVSPRIIAQMSAARDRIDADAAAGVREGGAAYVAPSAPMAAPAAAAPPAPGEPSTPEQVTDRAAQARQKSLEEAGEASADNPPDGEPDADSATAG